MRITGGNGNSGDLVELDQYGTGRTMYLKAQNADKNSRSSMQYTYDGRLGIGYFPGVDLSAESIINFAGSEQHITHIFDADLDLSTPYVGGSVNKGTYHRTINFNSSVVRTMTLSTFFNAIGREYYVFNYGTANVIINCLTGEFFSNGNPSYTLLPNTGIYLQSANVGTVIRWAGYNLTLI